MRLRAFLVVLILLVVPAVMGCGEEERPGADRLSRDDAIERIDALCRQTYRQVEQAEPEPSVEYGMRVALQRYARWQQRVLAATEAGLHRIERVAIPADERAKEIEAYAYI